MNMKVPISVWNSTGDSPVREYESTTADMTEVNEYIHSLEKQTGMKAFDKVNGEVIHEVTRETKDVSLTPQMAGG
jgi:hypothetical protein